mmetsp:Transcript_84381/g.126498  ORF Transcript_84381/g.126498 Transcript_84381/m.126498 type:complete len:128 (-) Transcript_84381:307-690(-)
MCRAASPQAKETTTTSHRRASRRLGTDSIGGPRLERTAAVVDTVGTVVAGTLAAGTDFVGTPAGLDFAGAPVVGTADSVGTLVVGVDSVGTPAVGTGRIVDTVAALRSGVAAARRPIPAWETVVRRR